MSEEQEFGTPKSVFVPLPTTERGFGIHISGAFVNGVPKIAYCNKNNVIIRNCEDPFDNVLYTEHREKVNVAKFSSNGEQIASGDSKGNVIVWSSKTLIEKNRVVACREVLDIDQTGDNQRIIAAGNGGGGKFGKAFPQNAKNSVGEIARHTKKVLSVAFRPTRPFKMISTSEDRLVNFYAGPPFKCKLSHNKHSNYPNCAKYRPDGSVFVTVGSDKKIIFYDGLEGEIIYEIDSTCRDQHKGSIFSCCWNKEGTKLMTASADKTVKIWDYETKEVETTFTLGKDVSDMQVACLQLGDYLISVSLSGVINFLDIDNPSTPKQVWNGHQTKINQICVYRPESLIYSCDLSGRICSQNWKTAEAKIFKGAGHSNKNTVAIALSANGEKLFSAGQDNSIALSNTKEHQFDSDQTWKLKKQPKCIAARQNDKGKSFFVGTTSSLLYVCNDGDLQEPLELGYLAMCMAISPDNSQLLIGGDDKFAHLYNIQNDDGSDTLALNLKEDEICKLQHSAEVLSVGFSGDGKFITTTDHDRHIFIWKNNPSEEETCYSEPINKSGQIFHSSRISGTDQNIDSNTLLTCSFDESIIHWLGIMKNKPLPQKKILNTHRGGTFSVHALDSDTFASLGDDRCIRLWNF